MKNIERSLSLEQGRFIDHIVNIEGVFSPTLSDFAKILGVTRKDVYSIIHYANLPSEDVVKKIELLSQFAERVASSGVRKNCYFLKVKCFDKRSLIDIFSLDFNSINIDINSIDGFINEVKIMEAQADAVVAKGPPTGDWLSSESIPYTPDKLD